MCNHDILSQENKAKTRARYKADAADPEKKKASVRDSYSTDIESKQSAKRQGSDIKRTSRRTALLKGRNTRTIQLPLRHLKGIGIGMTPLSDWLNVLISMHRAILKGHWRGEGGKVQNFM